MFFCVMQDISAGEQLHQIHLPLKVKKDVFLNEAVWIMGPLTFNPRQVISNQTHDYNDPLQVNHNKLVRMSKYFIQ